MVLGSTRRYATEFYQPLTLRNGLFASAYGGVQRAPEYIFDGDQRVAEYDVLTETAGLDLGMPLGTPGKYAWASSGCTSTATPRSAVRNFPTIRSTETGARLLVRGIRSTTRISRAAA